MNLIWYGKRAECVQNYAPEVEYILSCFWSQLPLPTITVCHQACWCLLEQSLAGTEVEAAACCCVSVGGINPDIKEETVGTAAGSIKILHCTGAWSVFVYWKTEGQFPSLSLKSETSAQSVKVKATGLALDFVLLLVCLCQKAPWQTKLVLNRFFLEWAWRCCGSVGTMSVRHSWCALCLRTRSSVLHQQITTGWIIWNTGNRFILHTCHCESPLLCVMYSNPVVSV